MKSKKNCGMVVWDNLEYPTNFVVYVKKFFSSLRIKGWQSSGKYNIATFLCKT